MYKENANCTYIEIEIANRMVGVQRTFNIDRISTSFYQNLSIPSCWGLQRVLMALINIVERK